MNGKIISCDQIIYLLDLKEITAKIIGNDHVFGDIFIPYSISYCSEEYVVVSISKGSFKNAKINSIIIPFYSKIQSIKKNAFLSSNITSLTIPPSLKELKNGWCSDTKSLIDVKVDENNPYFKSIDGKMIFGKSKIDSENFDVLVFCVRDIESVIIPNFIKQIGPFAFENCKQLHSVEISMDSELQIISEHAFCFASIEIIEIPPHVTIIDDFAFCFTPLQKVVFSEDSELKRINKYAFNETSINNFTIPPNLEIIDESAFGVCKKLRNVEIPFNSKLQTIGKNAFVESSIEKFSIPRHLKVICKCAFSYCYELNEIEIPLNSELHKIESNAFYGLNIEKLTFPSSLIELDKGWCNCTYSLNKINVMPNNPRYSWFDEKIIIGKSLIGSTDYDVLEFCSRNTKALRIPSFIKVIGPFSFEGCHQLRYVQIPANSELKVIGECAFSESLIETFKVPNKLMCIDEAAFCECNKLCKFDISNNSELHTIKALAFYHCSICSFIFPSHLTTIIETSFSDCKHLQIVEVDKNIEMKLIKPNIFSGSEQVIVMIQN